MRRLLGPCSAALLMLLALGTSTGNAAAVGGDSLSGEKIYRDGQLPSGLPLRGLRAQGIVSEGAVAACVNCHRRSGLGSTEGTLAIPPITSKYLFNRAGVQAGRPTLSSSAASVARRDAYDVASLAAAIRNGVGRGGRELNAVMPRYALSDVEMASLIAYLRTLPVTWSPGVSDTTIDLATIFTPDADPVARDAMLSVLEQFFADKNSFIRGGAKPMQTTGRIEYRVTRRWQLHVWNLTGAPSGWEAQLRAHLSAEPVLAVLSGIGAADWAPVHHFCETMQLPCLFPNVDVPVDAESDYYSLYFSKAALLESELLAQRLRGLPALRRVIQVYAPGGAGEKAAARLAQLVDPSIEVDMRPVRRGDAPALATAGRGASATEVLMLWLDRSDIGLLAERPPTVAKIYVSGTLAGFEYAPLPAAWRPLTEMTYPVDLPQERAVRMNYPLRWMQIRQLPIVAEKVQADTYLACGIVSEALNEMLDSFMRDFLIERVESMVSHRQLTGYYPRMGLAPGQRFASKGGYFVRFTNPAGVAVAATTEWLIP